VGLLAVSKDGKRVIFHTARQLVRADHDQNADIYRRFHGKTSLISTGRHRGDSRDATFVATSADGKTVLFTTREQLIAADRDRDADLYERHGGATRLVASHVKGIGDRNARFVGSSNGGRHLYFTVQGRPAIYELLADGARRAAGSGPFAGASADGHKVFTGLRPEDPDAAGPITAYRDGQAESIVAKGMFEGNSDDGSTIFFLSRSKLVTDDTDSCIDVYAHRGTGNTLISTGSSSGDRNLNAWFDGASADGDRAFFTTKESLAPGVAPPSHSGRNGYRDPYRVYERAFGATRLVASFDGDGYGQSPLLAEISNDGMHALFETKASLSPADHDRGTRDVYDYSDDATTLVSTGPRRANSRERASFLSAFFDGRGVFFVTKSALVSGDRDHAADVYERSDGVTRLISTADGPGRSRLSLDLLPMKPYLPAWPFGREFLTSDDGRRVFISTPMSLTANDNNPFWDVYMHIRGRTRLISGRSGGFPWPKRGATLCCYL